MFGVCGPAAYSHAKGLATVLLDLWDWGTGFATVATASLLIVVALISLTKNLPSAPVIAISLFGALAILVGSQIAQLNVGTRLVHRAFRYATPSWGLWFAFVPSLLGVSVGIYWKKRLQTPRSRSDSDIR